MAEEEAAKKKRSPPRSPRKQLKRRKRLPRKLLPRKQQLGRQRRQARRSLLSRCLLNRRQCQCRVSPLRMDIRAICRVVIPSRATHREPATRKCRRPTISHPVIPAHGLSVRRPGGPGYPQGYPAPGSHVPAPPQMPGQAMPGQRPVAPNYPPGVPGPPAVGMPLGSRDPAIASGGTSAPDARISRSSGRARSRPRRTLCLLQRSRINSNFCSNSWVNRARYPRRHPFPAIDRGQFLRHKDPFRKRADRNCR